MHDDFRIAVRAKDVAIAEELLAQLEVVVNLAVEDDLYAAVFVAERLLAGSEVDDGQSSMSEADTGADPETLSVRPAMGDAICHRLEKWRFHRTLMIEI